MFWSFNCDGKTYSNLNAEDVMCCPREFRIFPYIAMQIKVVDLSEIFVRDALRIPSKAIWSKKELFETKQTMPSRP